MKTPWVVMRSKNDAPLISATLEGVRSQTIPCKILNIDSGSTDGTAAIIRRFTDRLIEIPPDEYVPGRVLNRGMEETTGDMVVFLNADAVPADRLWLENLLAPMAEEGVAAVYGRQAPRPGARPLFRRETERAFGDGREAARWSHFFSMASSAVRRSVWLERPFDPEIRYSEDIEWTLWARRAGYAIRYAADSVAVHSHDYTLAQSYRRHFGEGEAEAIIFGRHGRDSEGEAGALAESAAAPGADRAAAPSSAKRAAAPRAAWMRVFLLPALAEIGRDLCYCLGPGRCPLSLFHSILLRPVQRWGHYRGFMKARKEYLWTVDSRRTEARPSRAASRPTWNVSAKPPSTPRAGTDSPPLFSGEDTAGARGPFTARGAKRNPTTTTTSS